MIELPGLRTSNPHNGSQGTTRAAMFARARERKARRELARAAVLSAGPWSLEAFPVVVEVVRVAPSEGLDEWDGLGASLKGVIDGVAEGLGLPGDRDPRVRWMPSQRRGPWGVEVWIAPAGSRLADARDQVELFGRSER